MYQVQRMTSCLVIAMVALTMAGPVGAEECLYRAGSWPFGPVTAVAVSGEYGYYGSGAALIVTDLVDPSRPELVAHLAMSTPIYEIAVAGEHAFLSAGERGLVVVDISRPTMPVVIANIDSIAPVGRIAASDSAAVAITSNGVWIVDMSKPGGTQKPNLLMGSMPLGSALDVAVTSSHAYVATRSSADHDHPGIAIFDVADPSLPRLITRMDLPLESHHRIYEIAADGDAVYLTEEDGLRVIDVAVPEAPAAVGRLVLDGASRLAVSGDFAYVVCGCEMRIVDVSSRTAPTPRGTYEIQDDGFIRDVAVSGHVALLADYRSQLIVADVSDPSAPQQLTSLTTPGAASQVVLFRDLAYVVEAGMGLRVFDMSIPSAPTPVALTPVALEPEIRGRLVIEGTRAYLVTDSSLLVFDVTKPDPLLIGSLVDSFAGAGSGLAIAGDAAYITSEFFGLVVVDISDPASMSVLGLGGVERAVSVAVDADMAYVGGSDDDGPGLYVVDVSDPSALVKRGFVRTSCHSFICGDPPVVAVTGDRVVVIDQRSLRILDVGDPDAPSEIGSLDIPQAWDLAISGPMVYAAAGSSGVLVVDISDPSAPRALEPLATTGDAWGVDLAGRLVVVAESYAGLSGYRYTRCASPMMPEGSPR